MNEYWEWGDFESSKLGMTAKFKFTCPFHENVVLVVKNCKMLNFSLRDDENKDSNAMDVVASCPVCGYVELFGVAIPKEHRQKIRRMIQYDKNRGFGIYTDVVRKNASVGNLEDNEWMDVYG